MQIVLRNRFVTLARGHSTARKLKPGKQSLHLGYVVTNLNHLSFERSDALEMCLDWFDSYTFILQQPATMLQSLLQGEMCIVCAASKLGVRTHLMACGVAMFKTCQRKASPELADELIKHHARMQTAEEHNRAIDEADAALDRYVRGDKDLTERPLRQHIAPFDKQLVVSKLLRKNSLFGVINVRTFLQLALIGSLAVTPRPHSHTRSVACVGKLRP
jgi:hypothetical protein